AAAPDDGRLAFSLFVSPFASPGPAGEPTHQIYTLAPDGSDGLTISDGSADDLAPAWSPDGRQIAFWRLGPDNANTGIWVMTHDGSNARQVLRTDLSIHRIDWSASGDTLAFVGVRIPERGGSQLDFEQHIYLVGLDGSGLQRLQVPGQITDFDWSPEGDRFVIERQHALGNDRVGYEIAVIGLDGGELAVLTDDDVSTDPSWSPDGSRIIFVRHDPEMFRRTDVFVMNADGSDVRQLTDDVATEESPTWSPRGDRIAFARMERGERCELVVMTTDTGIETVAADGSSLGGCPLDVGWGGPGSDEAATPMSEAEPSTTAAPGVDPDNADIGLGYPVCDVSSIRGEFSVGVEGTAYVAARVTEHGGCPTEAGDHVLAVDATGDGLADASFGPLECDGWCSAYAAPDVDGDGTDEVLVQNVPFAILGLHLYDVHTPSREMAVVPITVAPPGSNRFGYEGFEGGEQPQFWVGGDAGLADAIRCEPYQEGRAFVSVTTSHPIEGADHVEVIETWFVLEGPEVRVVDVQDYEALIDGSRRYLDTDGCGTTFPYP
ncbi:MAG TPA: hypothetical protein VEC09_07065, partial [Actinomycetota bacterium]|nr:hypothetical protein [Actinomycetota bacterium]